MDVGADAPNVDVTAVSEKWVKSEVHCQRRQRLEFFIDRKCYDSEHDAALNPCSC